MGGVGTCALVSMTIVCAFCSQTSLQKSGTVSGRGPCVAMNPWTFMNPYRETGREREMEVMGIFQELGQ